MKKTHAYTIAIDLGGTNLKAALIQDRYIISRRNLATQDFADWRDLLGALIEVVHQLKELATLKKKKVLGIGVGVPGPVDFKEGMVYFFPNIPGWHNVRLRQILREKTGLPVSVDNDANLMGLAEAFYGAGKKSRNMVAVTLGTGVGGAILINRTLYRGSNFLAGEIGHIPLGVRGRSCPCAGKACLERYVGRDAIARRGRQLIGRNLSPAQLSALAHKGNKKALMLWREIATYLGVALSGVVNVFNPDYIVVGGGIAQAGDVLFGPLREIIISRAMPVQARKVKVVPALLGADAGLIGAAILAREVSGNADFS